MLIKGFILSHDLKPSPGGSIDISDLLRCISVCTTENLTTIFIQRVEDSAQDKWNGRGERSQERGTFDPDR